MSAAEQHQLVQPHLESFNAMFGRGGGLDTVVSLMEPETLFPRELAEHADLLEAPMTCMSPMLSSSQLT